MNLRDAQDLASRLLLSLDPYCARVAVAGSVRRQVPEVKDIEVVAIPNDRDRMRIVDEWAPGFGARWIKTGTPVAVPWRPKADGRYWRALLDEGLKLDLFLCAPENWGTILLIRTGSAEFSEAVATHGKRIGKRFHEGRLSVLNGLAWTAIPTPEERDVFGELGLAWVPPERRLDGKALSSTSVR